MKKYLCRPLKPLRRALTLMLLGAASSASAQQKNVLLIIADDFGADSFPLTAGAGASLPPMPNIAALKNSGVLFTQARTQPTCSPTRSCVLTGRQPFRTGIGAQLTDGTSPQLQAAEFTLPEAFAANAGLGYDLAMFGKWHLNSGAGVNDAPRTIGGWPQFAGTIIGALPDYSAWTKVTNGVSAATTSYATTDTANDVVSWIDARGASPWFAWVAFNAPHSPFHFPPDALHSYDAAAATNRNHYEAMCEALDTEVGRILSHVNLATTHVIFIGDNGTPGEVIQPPYTATHAKGTLYDGGLRVPLIIAGPSVVNPNRTSPAPVQAVDLYATILEMAGIDVRATQPAANPIDSNSLTPILQNTPDTTRYAFSQQFGGSLSPAASGRAITDAAGYKLILFDDGRQEFYKTATDANETTNLLGKTISLSDQTAYAALKLQLASYQTDSATSAPLLSSWFTENSDQYARIYPTLADMNNRNSVTTWSRGAGVQSAPTYAGVHQIDYSNTWVYIHTTGLASHIMGPWYLNAAKSNLFPNYPANTARIYRFPRTPTIPAGKTNTGLGDTGRMVNGVSMFDSRDAFSYSTANAADATPAGAFTGDGIWNRDGYHNESVTFDAAFAHQGGNNYHYHAQPIALRHQLGDHVDFNAATQTYSESAEPATRHSPILAWAADGFPVYGPYGYANSLDAGSGVRRMVSGYVLRNGSVGTTNLVATGRTSLPAWAARIQARAATLSPNQHGPAAGAAYLLGHYIEDFDYLGDHGFSQGVDFDLNEQNVRFGVTPEFPEGTWAYFTTINADGTPAYPYTTGRQFYGSPTGGIVATIAEPVATSFIGGPLTRDEAGGVTGTLGETGELTLTWSGVEGGRYTVEASNTLESWSPIATGVTITNGDIGVFSETGPTLATDKRFYRVGRTSLAAFDNTGFAGTVGGGNLATIAPGGSAARGTVVDVTITLTAPPTVPAAALPQSVTLAGTIVGTNFSRPTSTQVKATFTIPAGAPTGAQTIIVTFAVPVYTLTGALTIQ